jgi:uncharacterized protein
MHDLLKIALVFVFILLLLRKKINIGFVMLAGTSLLFILFRMPLTLIYITGENAIISPVTIQLTLILSFIRMFELILREHDVLTEMMNAVKAIFRNRKIVTVSMPLLIGLMPSVGGAYFSAPMVAETTRDTEISPEEKGFINYWFRHPWECILPLYPGILLAAAVTKIELHYLITANSTYAALLVTAGFLFSMRGLHGPIKLEEKFSTRGLWSFLPISAVLLLVVIFHVGLSYALLSAVLFLLIFYRYKFKAILNIIRHGFSFDVIILILGVMLFKEAMETSGAVKSMSGFFIQEGIPVLPIIFFLPFITGILTGLTVGFVGSTFPLITSIAGTSVSAISFAFAAGFLGVLLSPVHICLVLTREYFKADMWGIYKLMIPGCIIIFIGALIQYLLLQ